jgi:hypothetical protein
MRRILAACLAIAISSAPASAQAKRKAFRYDPNQPVPAGHHVEERSNAGLAIAGGAALLTGTVFIVYGIMQRNDERRLYEERRANDPMYAGSDDISGGGLMILTGAIFAAAGAPLLIVGLTTKRSVLVRDNLAITPVATPNFGGFALTGTF